MRLLTSKGTPFLISDEDHDLIAPYKWHTLFHGYIGTNVKIEEGWKAVKLHRMLLGETDPNVFVDHVNGDITDNRRENLRRSNRGQNAANQRARRGSISSFKGVTFANGNARPWRAAIKAKVIGHFFTEKEAAVAYDTAAREMYGEFARLNLPESAERLYGTHTIVKRCERCGTRFEAKLLAAKYCKKSCANAVGAERRKARELFD